MNKAAGATLLKQYLKFMKTGESFDSILKNVNIISVADGKCTAEFTLQLNQTNAFGFMHGGFSATLVDILSGVALLSHKRAGAGVSVNLNLSYLKGASIGDQILVEAKTIKAGKSMGFLEVEIKNKETGDLLVTGTHTKFIGGD